ncbi:MAG: hypothetical protein M0026_13055 [Nocardiopsaceae bacterium]|nr:hypothetical protein [Nocardiopsaceae bacterium]
MRRSSAANADTTDIYIHDPETLSTAQIMGDACAVCHVKWPRPQYPLGVLPDGTGLFGCAECADLAAEHAARSLQHALVAR